MGMGHLGRQRARPFLQPPPHPGQLTEYQCPLRLRLHCAGASEQLLTPSSLFSAEPIVSCLRPIWLCRSGLPNTTDLEESFNPNTECRVRVPPPPPLPLRAWHAVLFSCYRTAPFRDTESLRAALRRYKGPRGGISFVDAPDIPPLYQVQSLWREHTQRPWCVILGAHGGCTLFLGGPVLCGAMGAAKASHIASPRAGIIRKDGDRGPGRVLLPCLLPAPYGQLPYDVYCATFPCPPPYATK